MKRLLMILALTSVLSALAMAGDIPTGESPAPAPSGTPQGISSNAPIPAPAVPGDMTTTDSAQPVAEGAWSAVLSVLGMII